MVDTKATSPPLNLFLALIVSKFRDKYFFLFIMNLIEQNVQVMILLTYVY